MSRRLLSGSDLQATHCPYCALNCGMKVDPENLEKPVRWKGSPLTEGALCSKGSSALQQVDHRDRLTTPLLRTDAGFVEIPWDEALDRAAVGFRQIAEQHGPEANAVLSGGSLTNEKVYLLGKLARLAFQTPNIDYNGRFCMAAAGKANNLAFGADRMMTPLDEIRNAEVVVVIGAHISAAFPVVVPKLLNYVRRTGGKVIVIDPRAGRFVKPEDLHLQLEPGTDSILFNGLLREVTTQGLLDQAFIENRTSGFEAARASVDGYNPEIVELLTDVSQHKLREAARLIGSTDRCVYLHGRGPEQQTSGTDNVLSIINLGLACGHVGGPGRGINMLTGQRNGQGGREWGQKCDQLPAGRSIENTEHRAQVAKHWGVSPESLPRTGKSYVEILEAAGEGSIRGLLSICTNMRVSAPNLTRVDPQLDALDQLVVIDPFMSRTAQKADLVLPGSTFTEEEGTITTIEGRVVRIDQATEPKSGYSDLDVLRSLAERLGAGDHFAFDRGREIFEEMRRVSQGGPVDYSGMTWDRIRDEGGVFWPCPTVEDGSEHPGTPQLYTERFAHPDGLARFHSVIPVDPPTRADADFPLVLTTGRVLPQFLSGTQTMRIESQNRLAPEPYVEINPDTARAYGLTDAGMVEIEGRLSTETVRWIPNKGLRHDTLFMPYHWVECNRLVASDLDPKSKIPGFKYTPVTIAPASAALVRTVDSDDRVRLQR